MTYMKKNIRSSDRLPFYKLNKKEKQTKKFI